MTRREAVLALAFLTFLGVYLTWPQAWHLRDAVVPHDDAFFSMWRLGWMGHALQVAPKHVFDGNIFFPEQRTLAYSDATFLEGAVAAPLLWAQMSTITVYNLLLLAGIVGSGVGMLVLAQHVTGNSRAALVAAAVFTLVPYRIEHVMHLELEWSMWIPLAFWSLHRTFETRSLRWGALTGVFVWLQLLSCVYYGIFLGLALVVLSCALLLDEHRHAIEKAMAAAVGAAIAIPLTILYARPYVENARAFGPRPLDQLARFSATPLSYATAPASNWLWGATAGRFHGNELHLFIGFVALALALCAFAAMGRRRTALIYGAVALFAVVMSFGSNTPIYSWLRAHLFVLSGLRAAARFSIVAFAAVSVLAGIGFEWLASLRPARAGMVMVGCLVALAIECGAAPIDLTRIGSVPDIYVMLRRMPSGPVVEFPPADPVSLPGSDPVYMFWSTTHWRPLVNGYSGYVSNGYLSRLRELEGFPRRGTMAWLQHLGVRYVIVHEAQYRPTELSALLIEIAQQSALIPVGSYRDSDGRAELFEIRRTVQQ